jgi:hypothetical protein
MRWICFSCGNIFAHFVGEPPERKRASLSRSASHIEHMRAQGIFLHPVYLFVTSFFSSQPNDSELPDAVAAKLHKRSQPCQFVSR